ncbi:MAG TPA: VTT domain-containing protein [Mariprofundaceae bacterium]|nr:VTT domain-containing protein [Mariprofundaceae bacterium]
MLEFVHQLVDWIGRHPHMAGLIVGLASCFESLAFVGILVPGALIMFAAGALVSSGTMEFWPTMVWGVAGAIVGDGSSYWLGHHYHGHIRQLWPFRRYPEMLARGEAFFQRHGSKSILFGRFVGPVRPVVPVVAGMMGMPPLRFYVSNVLSALGWAPAYLILGMAFADSLMLAGEVAGRLALLLGVLLLTVWGIAALIHRLYRWFQPHANRWVEQAMHWGHHHRRVRWLIADLVDPERPGFRALFAWFSVMIVGAWLFIGVVRGAFSQGGLTSAGESLYQLLQGLRTSMGDHLMIVCNILGSLPVMLSVSLSVLAWLVWRRAWRDALYWLAAIALSAMTVVVLQAVVAVPRPLPILQVADSYSFPSAHVTVSTVIYGLLAVFTAQGLSLRWRWWAYAVAAFLIFSEAFSRLYLGVHWLSDVTGGLSLGVVWVALVAIARQRHAHGTMHGVPVVAMAALILAGGWQIHAQIGGGVRQYAPRKAFLHMSASAWWQRDWRRLPVYLIDLEGDPKQPLNLQWAGQISAIRKYLVAHGWHQPLQINLRTAPNWLLPNPSVSDLPVPPQLHNGQSESLLLVHAVEDRRGQMILRLWSTSIHLQPGSVSLWVGTVTRQRIQHLPLITILRNTYTYDKALIDLRPMLEGVRSKRVKRHGGHVRFMSSWQEDVLLIATDRLRL